MTKDKYLALADLQAIWDDSIKPWITSIAGSYLPTLSGAPTSSTTTYTKDGQTYSFAVGGFCRVADQGEPGGYGLYQLLDLNNGTAAWRKCYDYSGLRFAVNPVSNSSTTLSLDGTVPVHVVTTTANITAVTLSQNPAEGHSCHVIIAASSEKTVAVTHHSTNRICPGGEDPDPLTIPAGGYVELDFLTANGKVYVRGV